MSSTSHDPTGTLSPEATEQLRTLSRLGCKVYARCSESGIAFVSVEYHVFGRRQYFRKSVSTASGQTAKDAAVDAAYRHFAEAVQLRKATLVPEVPSVGRELARLGGTRWWGDERH